MSKESFTFRQWLMMRARDSAEAGALEGNAGGGFEGPARAAPARLPTGHPGLPSDWLFSMAVEAVMIVETATQRIVQANPAAAGLLGIAPAALGGSRLLEVFDAASAESLMGSMTTAQAAGAADEVACRSRDQGTELTAKLSLLRVETESYFLVRLAPMAGDAPQIGALSPAFEAIETAGVGFLLTDSGLRVEYANQALIDMVELEPPAEVRGKSLARWLEFSAADLDRLALQMRQRQATAIMTTRLRPERSAPVEVEICAVAVPDGPQTCWGFTIRELPRLN